MKNILRQIPNFLTISRVILTFIVTYLIITESDIKLIITLFAIAALTDFFDGQLARRFNWTSEFGRKADMIADRFLWIGTALAFVISFGVNGLLSTEQGIQILFIMSREIISAPFAVAYSLSKRKIPHATKIAKITTFVQGFALPSLILSTYYPTWTFLSWPLSIICLVIGTISAIKYIKETDKEEKKEENK